MLVFAHPSHWLASIMYAMPVVVLVGFLAVARIKDRKQRRNQPEAPQPPDVTV